MVNVRLEDKYALKKEYILDGELPEFEPVDKPKRERQPMYLAAIVDEFMETTFADMRDLLAQSLETRLSTDHIYRRDCFNRLMFIIRRNEMDNILDLYDYIQSGNDNMIHTVQMLTQTIAYNTELVQLMFEGVRQKKRDSTGLLYEDLSPIDTEHVNDDDNIIDDNALRYDDIVEEIDDVSHDDIDDVIGDIDSALLEVEAIDDIDDVADDIDAVVFNTCVETTEYIPKYSAKDVKQIRKAHKLTLPEFAQLINIQRSHTISNWEQGKSKPSKQSCENIRRFLNNMPDIDSKQVIHTPNDIRYIRDTYGVTKSAIAKKTGVSVNAVRNWEYGKHTPSYEESEKLKQFICELDIQ